MTKFSNIFTIDLEEWFVVEALAHRYNISQWEGLEATVVDATYHLLDMLDRKKVKATWFVLGWVADKYPEVLQEVFYRGHEIGCHSYQHRRVDLLGEEEFLRDTDRAVECIVRAIGNRPIGYRAPSWSVNGSTPWFFEQLTNLGFVYDSSIFPIKHDIYGWPEGPSETITMEFENGKKLIEIPASVISIGGKNIPVAGGGYFRHSPYWYTKSIVNKMNKKGTAAVFYIHPWEMIDKLPKIEGLTAIQRFRTYSSNALLKYKIEKLLDDFRFVPMAEAIGKEWKKRIGF